MPAKKPKKPKSQDMRYKKATSRSPAQRRASLRSKGKKK